MFDATAIVEKLRSAGFGDAEDERILSHLRASGLSLVQSAIVYAKLRGVSLSDAKELAADSQTWSSDFAKHQKFHDSLEQAASDETA